MPMTLPALKSELLNDPQALGYGPFVATGTTWKLAELLNAASASFPIFRPDILTWEIVACTVKSEYDSLPAGDKQLYQILVSTGVVNATDSRIRAMFASIFGPATTTRANLNTMASRSGSRAEALFGVAVTSEDCAKALAS